MSDKPFKTVYFLGAGASHASRFSLPLMKGFFNKKDFSEAEYPNLKEFIHQVAPHTDIEGVNLEDLITHLELSLDDMGAKWQEERTLERKARQELYTYIRKRLSLPEKGPYYCELHLKLAKTLEDVDSILTLNYDLVMDFALLQEAKDRDQRRSSPKGDILERSHYLLHDLELAAVAEWPTRYYDHIGKGLYIKLHGSIDWLYCPNPVCNYHQLVFISRQPGRPRIDPGAPCSGCGTALSPVIVPPTMRKSLQRFPKLGYLWNAAFRELKEANRLIFFGVSLPKSDYLLRWLIRESTVSRERSPELILIDLEQEKERLTRELGELTEPKETRWCSSIGEFFEKEL